MARAVSTASGSKVWNLTTSAPASAATSIMRQASSSEPSWFTPASAMIRTGSVMGRLAVEEPLAQQDVARRRRAQGLDDPRGALAVAIRIVEAGDVAGHGAGDGRGDGRRIRIDMKNRWARQSTGLPQADIHRRRP